MQVLSSESAGFLDQILDKRFSSLVLDIESLDNNLLFDEPIVSFSVSFPTESMGDWRSPTVTYICEYLAEEKQLLIMLSKLLWAYRESLVAGHNISCFYKNILHWKSGYDLPKIWKRAKFHDLNLDFIKNIRVFDTMDEAYLNYDHSIHNRRFDGKVQKILSCVQIENDFQIQRPRWLPKLGLKVRQHYLQYLVDRKTDQIKKLALYNASDTIIESIITKIFLHQSGGICDAFSNTISPLKKCHHVPQRFVLIENPTFIKLMTTSLSRI
jgi:hypothetical protein